MTAGIASNPNPGRLQVRSLVLWVTLGFDLMVLGLAGWTLVHSRSRYVERAEVTAHNLALVIEQNLIGTIRQGEMVLQTVKDQVERADTFGDRQEIATEVAQQFAHTALLDSLGTTDALGLLQHWAGGRPMPDLDVSRRSFFQHFLGGPQKGLFITPPSQDGAGGAWVLTLALPMARADGAFRGVVFATIRLEKFNRELTQIDVGSSGSISLRGGNLGLLARLPTFPGEDTFFGDTRISGDYLEAVQSGRRESHFTTFSRLDGTVRTYSFRRLADPPFYVLVGLAQKDYLAAWRQEALLSGSAVVGIISLSLGMAWLVRRTWQQQLVGQAERDQLITELTQALAEVRSLAGLLPICAQCKKIRDDQGYWNHLESYLSAHTDATFTHGVCPDCAQDMRRELHHRREHREPD